METKHDDVNGASADRPGALPWHSKAEIGGELGIRFAVALYRLFGSPIAAIVCTIVPWLVYLFDRETREASMKYLTRALGRPATRRDVIRHLNAFARCTRHAIDSWIMPPHEIPMRGDGLRTLHAHADNAVGALVLGAHFGPLESCRSISRNHPTLGLAALVYGANSRGFRETLKRLNAEAELNLIAVENIGPTLLIQLEERLARGQSVALLADRLTAKSPDRAAVAPFLGEEAAFPEGPFILATILKCPVVFLVPYFDDDGTIAFHGASLPAISHLPRGEAIRTLLDAYVRELEIAARAHPYYFFNFYDFWRAAPRAPARRRGTSGADERPRPR